MPYYECVFIARQDISPAQVESLAKNFAEIIKREGGEVTKTEHWGLRNLAYRIKKNKKGHYVLFNINAPAPAVAEMERNMRINEDILRYLTVKVSKLEEGPSIMMRREDPQNRQEIDSMEIEEEKTLKDRPLRSRRSMQKPNLAEEGEEA